MKPKTRELLSYIIEDEDLQTKWINSQNTYFNMSPQKMIDEGNKDKVYAYLHFYVYGPY